MDRSRDGGGGGGGRQKGTLLNIHTQINRHRTEKKD